MPGPPWLLKDSDLKDLNNQLTKSNGSTFGRKIIKAKIEESQKKAVMERGLVPIIIEDINPTQQTLTNYCALLAHQ